MELPAANGVDLWAIDLAGGQPAAKVLSADELGRAATMRSEPARRRFMRARGSLRLLLGRYLTEDPGELVFSSEGNCKPRLSGQAISFNIAHSGELALIAIARARPVGVDVEQIRARADPLGLARRYFSPPEADWVEQASPDARATRFYRLWVAKEAFVKATGAGLAGGLGSHTIELEPRPRVVAPAEARHWWLEPFSPGVGYVAALVSDGALERSPLRHFEPSDQAAGHSASRS